MREITGEKECSKLATFFYLLIRDELPAGVVERIVMECEKSGDKNKMTNGHIAEYANLIEKRLCV
jgi:hypothetical protein